MLALFTVIAGRLMVLQLADADQLVKASLNSRLERVTLPAHRGGILDRGGNVLVQSVEARDVVADPSHITNPAGIADALGPVLAEAAGVTRSDLLAALSRTTHADGRTPNRYQVLVHAIDVDTADRIATMNLTGIRLEQAERRDVPGHDLAANVLGFTNYDLTGVRGIEQQYDGLLRGEDGLREYEAGHGDLDTEIPGGYARTKQPKPGTSVQLTIDRDLQYQVQNILATRMRSKNLPIGAAVVLDVHTGEVLAQASYPSYNAAEGGRYPAETWADACTQLVVDPGSIHKMITVGAALQEGVINPGSRIPVAPAITKGDTTFRDTHPFRAGTQITVPELLAFSSNVGTITVADRLGASRLYDYQRKFGLGSATGVGLPGESAGLIQPPGNWSGSSYGSIPIGDGVSVTPLQMASAYAAIANDGEWVQPHLVKATQPPGGALTPTAGPARHRVVSPQTAGGLRTMMEAVTTVRGATGRSAAIEGYRVAGKTGTGLRVLDGRYVAGASVGSFIGMAPADAPRYVIAVFAYSPNGDEGGAIAGPAFHDMMSFTLGHYQVPPTGAPAPTFPLTQP
jgi:cell division protein FtsI (penicillin-binding protein 3)